MEGFRSRLSEVVREIAELPQQERLRWLELLSYIDAFVYHVRNASEHPELIGMVEASAATDEERRAIMAVEMTMATYHREQAVISANQETLIRLLRLRFGELPVELTDRVYNTHKVKILNAWLDRVVTAKSLSDMGILNPKRARK